MSGAMADAMDARADLDGLACVDLRSGFVLAASTRDEESREALEFAAQTAAQLCAAPKLDVADEDVSRTRETLVVSGTAIHAFALSKRQPDYVVVGVAHGSANVALLLASVRSVADSLLD